MIYREYADTETQKNLDAVLSIIPAHIQDDGSYHLYDGNGGVIEIYIDKESYGPLYGEEYVCIWFFNSEYKIFNNNDINKEIKNLLNDIQTKIGQKQTELNCLTRLLGQIKR